MEFYVIRRIKLKNKNLLKRIAIILSIILLLLNIFLYVKMRFTWSELDSTNEQYQSINLLVEGIFRFAILIWGILLIPMVWLEYFLIKLLMKIYNKFDGFKRILLCLITLVLLTIILDFFIRVISLIIVTLV